ncbi:MAG: M3 family oligoendopeptidase [bacterium]|nr:M3 family oligoendopeptidase [bacterium]
METAELTKFKDFKYIRPDLEVFAERFGLLLKEFQIAGSGKEQYEALKKINEVRKDFDTMRSIASIRYTIDTEDKFYNSEHEYFDNAGPVYSGFRKQLYAALLESEYADELKEHTGNELFEIAKRYMKTYSPEIIEDLKLENRLATEYVRLIASAKITFEGEERNIAGMAPFLESMNREVRKNASETKWKFFEDNEESFDRIYDELVKVRTSIAKKLGYENFIQLAYDRMDRSGYYPEDIAKFRDSVKTFIVPVNERGREIKKKQLGLDKLYYYDSGFDFKDGNPDPKGPPEWIVEKAKKMYEDLSEETGKFINIMIDDELMDLYNRKGKAAGGYCSYIPNYESPFIFANMNGTSHDIKVLTHEAGHAFQAYESRYFEMPEYVHPTLEACEIHSMSMEFITWPWMELFFEEDTDKFLYSHLVRALKFIPYGCTVDEFQHYVYTNPDATPKERKIKWREIENKYSPWTNYEGNDFLERGGFWFQQGHIFRRPFYYIDYCLAQICALQFWRKCNNDKDIAWEDYVRLCKAGGSKPFLELLDVAKIDSPFDRNVVKSIVEYVSEWLNNVEKEFELEN